MTTTNTTTSQKTIAPASRPVLSGILASVWDRMGMLLILIVLFVTVSVLVPNFLTRVNLLGLALALTTVGVIACTMLFCLAAGDFDLSAGAVVAMSGMLAAVVINATGSVLLGVAAGILAGGMVGLINGVVIAYVGINALITTLATMQMVQGLAFLVNDGKSVGIREGCFFALGTSSFLGVVTPIWIMLACFVLFGLLLNRTTFGRNTLAIGGNKEAAHLAGISVARVKLTIFAMQGMIAGLAGIVLSSRMTTGQPTTDTSLVLQVISACVLGGVSLAGGVGTITGMITGVLIMGIVQNVMNLLNIPTFYQYVVSGAILLTAVMLDRLQQIRRRMQNR
jgi:L-arabinose transport system permease protein